MRQRQRALKSDHGGKVSRRRLKWWRLMTFLALTLTGAGAQVMQALSSNQPLPEQMILALRDVCTRAIERNARIFIDAEQQSVQPGIDTVALDLMCRYIRNKTAVEGFTLGAKLVRGAYIDSELRRVINDTKLKTDESYNSIAAVILRRQYGPFSADRNFP
ncbi:FAD-linked oxidoreductase-like protein [Aspergillus leporis]|uniref:Proline dehydrogenase n=1 Tax=Aspergillus leporis TaxID=41062 RepID=A0A5N5X8K3_9EURO|nr:FAD-linked oxidoreductase-like protein [Aspergillus leporis]